MRICIAGKNNIAVWAVQYLLQSGICKNDILILPNTNDCGIDTWQYSLLKYAQDMHLTLVSLNDIYQIPNLLFISLEFDKLIKIEKFASTRLFNIHFSNLPKYKGAYTAIMPILHGENIAGVTLHKIDNGIDTGCIVKQITFPIALNDTARDLYMHYNYYALLLFKQNFASLLHDTYTTIPQDYKNGSYFSRKEIDFSNITINLKKTSFEIHNQLRAFIFREYQLPNLYGINIMRSTLTQDFIGSNIMIEQNDRFILSGIDGFSIIAYKDIS